MKKFKVIFIAFLAFVVVNASFLRAREMKTERQRAKEELKKIRDEFKSELHKAIAYEDFNKVKKLVEAKKGKERAKYVNLEDKLMVGPGKKESVGIAPLFLACMAGNKKIVEYLIANGADVNLKMEARGPGPANLLGISAMLGDKDLLELLLKKGAKVGLQDALMAATNNDNLEVFKLLEKYGAKMESIEGKLRLLNSLNILKYLIEEKKFDIAPILQEALPYKKDVVKYLIEKKKLDANAKDKRGASLIFMMMHAADPEFIEYLVGKGANIKAVDKQGNILLHGAFWRGLDLVKYLVGKGLDVNATNKDKRTPLHNAASKLDIVEFLVGKGAKVNAEDKKGNTPLHNAGKLDVFKFLVSKGADINKFNKNNITPLGNTWKLDIVKYVLDKKAKDVTLENIISSLGKFVKRGQLDFIKYMLAKKGKELTAKHIDDFIKIAKERMKSRIDGDEKDLAKAKDKEWIKDIRESMEETKKGYGEVIKMLEELKAAKK